MKSTDKPKIYRTLGILMLMTVAVMSLGCVRKPPDVLVKPQSRQLVESKLDKKIIQLVTESYIPYGYEENGLVKGVAVDVVTEAFRRIGYNVELKMLPWTRALQMVEDGDTDGIFCAFYSDERAIFMDYLQEPLAYEAQYCYTLKDSSVVFDGTLDSLKPYRIGVIQDWYYGAAFDEAVKSGDFAVERVTDLSVNIQKLLDGRIDVIVNPRLSTLYYLKQMKIQDRVVEQTVPFREPTALYLGFTKKRFLDPALVRDIDTELAEMKADGTYQRIVDQYIR